MLALLLFASITFSKTITIPNRVDDNGKYVSFKSYKIGDCYLKNSFQETIVELKVIDDAYTICNYQSTDCTGLHTYQDVETYQEGSLDFSGATFTDEEVCILKDNT
ncbi:hypothetical protein QTN25_007283 [Entamoeba marina]